MLICHHKGRRMSAAECCPSKCRATAVSQVSCRASLGRVVEAFFNLTEESLLPHRQKKHGSQINRQLQHPALVVRMLISANVPHKNLDTCNYSCPQRGVAPPNNTLSRIQVAVWLAWRWNPLLLDRIRRRPWHVHPWGLTCCSALPPLRINCNAMISRNFSACHMSYCRRMSSSSWCLELHGLLCPVPLPWMSLLTSIRCTNMPLRFVCLW